MTGMVPATQDPAGTPDPRLVGLYRALGDGTRLRILRRLAAGAATVGRISEELGLAKSTVHEHLFSLRAAGLVRLVVNGGFALEPEIPDLNRMLKEFLGLEMRRQCEGCARPVRPGGVAYICSFECTFCDTCATRHGHVCPNCGGELVRRPCRTSRRRVAQAPSITTHMSAPGRH
jgi:biotin operon repressor